MMSCNEQEQAPNIHIYGSDHSPWTQSVITFLEYKKLNYTINTTPYLRSIIHNNSNVSYFQMPVLHYNNQIISESLDILKFIHNKHPQPPLKSSDITSSDKDNLQRFFLHAITRTKSRLFRFFYKWSLQKDDPTSFISLFLRPSVALYFAMLITMAQKLKIEEITKMFKDPQIEDKNAYYPQNTFIYALKYFQNLYERKQLYCNDNEYPYPSLIDFQLIGQFQCLYSGLSDECIPLINKYFPSSKTWLKLMHQNVVSKYHRLYTKNEITENNYLERGIYWIGLIAGFPLNITFALITLITRGKHAPKSKL